MAVSGARADKASTLRSAGLNGAPAGGETSQKCEPEIQSTDPLQQMPHKQPFIQGPLTQPYSHSLCSVAFADTSEKRCR